MKQKLIVISLYFVYTLQAILSPNQLVDRLMELNNKYRDYVKVDTAQTRYNIPSNNKCITDKEERDSIEFNRKIKDKHGRDKKSYYPSPCDNLIVLVTDFNTYNLDRPQVYISGSTEGSNTIGPTIVYEFIKFLVVESKNRPEWIRSLLKKVMIVITPNTNAYGFATNSNLDISNQSTDEKVNPLEQDFFVRGREKVKDQIQSCLKTSTVKTIDYLFNEFNFLQAILLKSGSENNFGVLRTNNIDYFYTISLAKQFYMAIGGIDSINDINDVATRLKWMSYSAPLIALSNLSNFFI